MARWTIQTHCKRGHELTSDNLYIHRKRRWCRICRTASVSRNRADFLYGKRYDRDAQLASQGNACAICGRTDCTWKNGIKDAWHTDHKHGTADIGRSNGTHRGVLCGRCNTALGNLEPHMDKVIAYLAKYAAEQGASTEGSVT